MDPQPPAASPPPTIPHNPGAPNDPYTFIMQQPKKTKPPRVSGTIRNSPFLMKIIFLIGSVAVVMIIAALVINFFFTTGANIQTVMRITATEQEIIRISGKGETASNQWIKNAAINTRASVTTQQQEWINFLAKRGEKADTKQLALKKNSATDTRLTQAQATSTFDTTFTQVMRSQLEAYATELKSAYSAATGTQEKALLEKHFKATNILLEQWADPMTTTP